MKKSKNVRLRGFTLVELIVVIAVFGLIMAAALSILGPVNSIFKSTVNYQSSADMVDNVSKYLEDNLRYSNRLWVYDEVSIGDEATFLQSKVNSMISEFYMKEPKKASQLVNDEKIYIIKIDNPNLASKADLDGNSIDRGYASSGRITAWEYDVSTGKWRTTDSSGAEVWSSSYAVYKPSAINEAFYIDNLYTTTIEEGYKGSTGDVTNLHFKLNVFHCTNINKPLEPFTNTNTENMVSFPLVNLVNSSAIISEDIYFYEDITKPKAEWKVDMNNPVKVFRYSYHKAGEYAIDLDPNTNDGLDIYMIFTKAPLIENY